MATKRTARRPRPPASKRPRRAIERVQTGVRLEKRMLKVLKALAEYLDITLGDLLEAIVLHAFDGKCPFTEPATLKTIGELKRVYKLDLDAADGHNLVEKDDGS